VQVLKDEIKNKILSTAENMFFENGFKKTSTRQIACDIGISVSNLYLYYKNKEDIISAVTDGFYRHFLHHFEDRLRHQDNAAHQDINELLSTLIIIDHKKYVILTDNSEGTKHEGFKAHLAVMLSEHMKSQMVAPSSANELIISIMANHFFDGIIQIARHYKDEVWLKKSIQMFLQYHFKGFNSFI
jgi:AcrR family transcriptional regulator